MVAEADVLEGDLAAKGVHAAVEVRGAFEIGFEGSGAQLHDFLGAGGAGLEDLGGVEEGVYGAPEHSLVAVEGEEGAEGDLAAQGHDAADEQEDVGAEGGQPGEEAVDHVEVGPVLDAFVAEGFGAGLEAAQEEGLGVEGADHFYAAEKLGGGGGEVGHAVGFLAVEGFEVAVHPEGEQGGERHGHEDDGGEADVYHEHEDHDDGEGAGAGEEVAQEAEDRAVHVHDIGGEAGGDAAGRHGLEKSLAGTGEMERGLESDVLEDVAGDLEDVVALPAVEDAAEEFEEDAEGDEAGEHPDLGRDAEPARDGGGGSGAFEDDLVDDDLAQIGDGGGHEAGEQGQGEDDHELAWVAADEAEQDG